jgi:hypothetical protein
MYIDEATSKARMDAYAQNQGPILEPIMSPEGPFLYYNVNDFVAMIVFFTDPKEFPDQAISGVRIYLSCYGKQGETDSPAGYEEKFTYVFAPVYGDKADLTTFIDYGKYYNIVPGGPFNTGTSEVDDETASGWVLNWQRGKLTELPAAKSAANFSTDGFTDSRSLVYTLSQLLPFVTESQCQQAYGIKLYLSSYTADDPKYPDRLTTQFILTDASGEAIVTDTSCRPPQGYSDYDTGLPCPPTPGCSGSGLPKK